jgi:ABC-2 type transport system ATP-binding protein
VQGGAAIHTSGLTKDFGQGHGVFGLDLEVRDGEIFGFPGANGAVKSTTMRLLLDLIVPTTGAASLLGLDSHRDSLAVRRRAGFLPGDSALHPKLTGTAALDHFADLRGGVEGSADPIVKALAAHEAALVLTAAAVQSFRRRDLWK